MRGASRSMPHLYEILDQRTRTWREQGYPCDDFPAIAEILDYQFLDDGKTPRFLRRPQIKALETWWYLRLIEGTPHIFDLYQRAYGKSDLLTALGADHDQIKDYVLDKGLPALWKRVKTDDDFVRDFRLQALRETLTLGYPSYIFALAMGAGKTILIGAIIATEFGMALEYPDADFVQNALVFAPGKTIIESLRELSQVPYDRVLPPRLYRHFEASLKLTFTRDGEKDIPVIRGSRFNVVVTNTEKIRIQKETIRKRDLGQLRLSTQKEDEARTEVANLRLQAIASLPHLAVFSDEAHHTYGQSLDTELKKVRKTVDYLSQQTDVVCVVNTTGTPYFQRQPLKDVVIWYGLSQGIREGYLKDLSDNIQAYDFSGDAAAYASHVVEDFLRDYRDVCLPNGAPAKLAMYFPQTSDLAELRPIIDRALVQVGQNPTVCLVNTSDEAQTRQADVDAFNRLNDPDAPHRVMLLVNKGTEGWNCPSLFACALVRRLRTSNNFVLQAASRCLRQVPGNTKKARVYLSADNFSVLDHQLQETYGETIADLNRMAQDSRSGRIILRKINLPPLCIRQERTEVVRRDERIGPLQLTRPVVSDDQGTVRTYTVAEQQATYSALRQVGDTVTITGVPEDTDAYAAAAELASRYRVDCWAVYDELRRLYGSDPIPISHLDPLARPIEEQTRHYETIKETIELALALVKPEGFEAQIGPDGAEVYTAEIVYPKDRERYLLHLQDLAGQNPGDFGFHYDPYDFDSNPEKSFFDLILREINLHPGEVEDIYFTGAITDPNKTDFFVEYKDEQGKWRRYTPDFVIRKKPGRGRHAGSGKVFIVEIKDARFEPTVRRELRAGDAVSLEGRKAMALQKWQHLDPDRVRYRLIFARGETIGHDQLTEARRFVEEAEA